MSKRGISAVIAAVLIILITIAAISILWAFVVPMIDTVMDMNKPVDLQIVQEGYTAWDPINRLAEIQVKRGSDEAEILGFDFIFDMNGNSITHKVRQDIGLNSKSVYYFNFSNIEGNLETVKIAPVYKNEKRGDVVSILKINSFGNQDLSGTGKIYVKPGTDGGSGAVPIVPGSPDCENEAGCSTVNSIGCSGNTPFTCVDNDADSCMEKILASAPCLTGYTCNAGDCVEDSCVAEAVSVTCAGTECGSKNNNCGTSVVCTNTCDSGESCIGNTCVDAGETVMRDSIEQYGITWYFDKQYPTGQFANRDYWVVGPLNIINITPQSSLNTTNGRVKNGAMVNPDISDSHREGYDTEFLKAYGIFYSADENAARPNGNDLSSSNPLILQPNSSLISSISLDFS
jgi:hypothetical protein